MNQTTDHIAPLAPWQHIFRHGIAPLLSDEALLALWYAVECDDPALVQEETTVPRANGDCYAAERAVTGACLIGYAGWRGEGLETVGEVHMFFSRFFLAAEAKIGDYTSLGEWIAWYDSTPRDEMRGALLPEIGRALDERGVELIRLADGATDAAELVTA